MQQEKNKQGFTGILSKNKRKQFFPNALSNIGIVILNTVIGIWFTPYLIKNLGIALYGLVPLATTIASYFTLVSISLNGAVGRFLTIDIQKQDTSSANKTFNTALLGNMGIFFLSLPVAIIIVWFVPEWFDVPKGYEEVAQGLFAAVAGGYFITILRTNFSVSSWASNRFDLRNAIIAVYHIARVGIVIILFILLQPNLLFVGVGVFFAELLGLVGDFLVWRKLTPELKIYPKDFDKSRVRQLFGMGGWLLVNQLGTMLFLNIDLIITNTLLGAEIAGAYGAILMFSVLLRRMAQTVSSVLTPTVIAKHTQGNKESLNRISKQAVRFMGLGMALPIGLLGGLAKPFLTLWLGPSYEQYSWLLIALTAHLSLNLSVLPLFGINVALNKVRIPGLVTVTMGVLNVILAIVFVRLGWGALGVAIAGAVVLTAKNVLFTPIYAAYIQELPWWTFVNSFMPSILGSLSVGFCMFVISHFLLLDNWINLLFLSAVVSVVYLTIIYFFVLDSTDHLLLKTFLSDYKG